ncbi:MAG: hypothetical protein K0R26_1276 [Bacteroidota bacterium]|nr:hypothetical protein [Bacteroidota bacterium]
MAANSDKNINMQERETFPAEIKRQLRQEAGFGCCKCGRPIVEYHHIVPYTKEDPHYRFKDMMCLCPYCHHEATVGAMILEEQRHLKKNPINIQKGRVNGLLKINQKQLVLSVGSNEFINDNEIITIDEEKIIELSQSENGAINLSLRLFDSDNKLILEIDENEWISGDMECSFQLLKLRQKMGKIAVTVDTRKNYISLTGTILYNGIELKITETKMFSTQLNAINTCFIGSTIKFNSNQKTISLNVHPVFKIAKVVTDPNREIRIRKGLKLFEEMKLNSSHTD